MKLAESDLAVVDLSSPRRVHLVGVGGSGMAPLAVLLAQAGHRVSGSDVRESGSLDDPRSAGVAVAVGQHAEQVHGADLVVTSTAVPPANVELVEARRLGIPVVHRGRVLGALTAQARTAVVAGTHGKTSTTSMVVTALRSAGHDVGWYIGAEPKGLPASARWPAAGGWFVVEGDESDGTLLELQADAAIVTNVEADHLDHWGDLDGLLAGMARFVASVAGPAVLCADDPGAAGLARPGDPTYGFGDGAAWRLSEPVPAGHRQRFTVTAPGDAAVAVDLPLRGRHMAQNAGGALTLAALLGVPPADAADGLGSFAGVGRRFDVRHRVGGVTLVDDYAHLPTEIRATLAAARSSMAADGWRRVVAVFQPNRPNRMVLLSPEYRDAFVDADVLVVADVYLSGEAPIEGVTGQLVVDAVRAAHPDLPVVYEPARADLAGAVVPLLRDGDVCISMGCGDVATLPDEVAPLLGERA